MRAALVSIALTTLASAAAAEPVRTSQSDPHPGIHRELWTDAAIPARLHLVRIDLTSAEIALYATKEADRGIRTTTYASRKAAQVAINGGPFAVAGYLPRGLAIGDSAVWSNTHDDEATSLFHLRRVGERTIAAIITPEVVVQPGDLPVGTEGAISGRPLLVRNGVVETRFDCNDPSTLACSRAPRSAVALSADGNQLWLVAVDGWQQGSLGMTALELATFLRARGAHAAIHLDGGSSSTLVIDGAIASSPSDGVERTVANHLAVKYGALPAGQLVGLVCKGDIFECGTNDALKLTGVQVTLDDGRVDVTGTDALYSFPNVTPRLACVTARKTGYRTKTACKVVSPGSPPTFNSMTLEAGTDPPPDAGVPDAMVTVDAAELTDGGMMPDGGATAMDSPGCCNTTRSSSHLPFGALVLAGAVGFRVMRRRGTSG